jgi:hypothetical protein
MKRFMRTSNGNYEVRYKGRTITLWREQNAKGRLVWGGSVEVRALS